MDCCCQAHSQSSRTAGAGVAMLSVSVAWARASSEPAPRRHNLGGLERHVILPWPVGSRHNPARSDPLQSPANPGQADAARAKRGKRRVLFAAPGYSRATRRGTSHPLNCRRFQPSQSTDPHQPAFALGSPVGVGIEGLAGEVESSCSHPREAMNLVHVRRISRRNRTAS